MVRADIKTEYLKAKRALFDKKYAFLNEKQREAVFTVDGPLLVLAGAGTGKTTVLTERIGFILKYGNAYYSETVPVGADEQSIKELRDALDYTEEELDTVLDSLRGRTPNPWNVIAITFTNKAAGEMKTRLGKIVGDKVGELWCGTFHSMCLRILRANAEAAGYRSGFTVYDEDDSKKVIAEAYRKFSINDKILPIKSVKNAISGAKDKLITAEEFDRDAENDFRLQQISTIYTYYQNRLKETNALDFDDIIMQTVFLLQNNPQVRARYQRQFDYVLIDEFQDTNHAQLALALLLSGGSGNIMVVGDDDQSIYKFRGATIENILHFDEKVDGVKEIKLEQNYRSTEYILDAANAVIRNNFGRRGKDLWCDRGDGDRIFVKQLDSQTEEGKFIVNKTTELVVREKRKYGDFAVLYRTNAQSNSIENAFVRSGIPYRILGGRRFYERKEVKDILAYLCVVSNHDDDLRLRRIINEPKRKIGEATLNSVEIIAENEGMSMFSVMKHCTDFTQTASSQSKFAPFIQLIETLSDFAAGNPEKVSELVRMTIELSGYEAMLLASEENGETTERRENVEELVSNAVEYEMSTENPSIADFLESIALIADIDNYDKSADAVVMMTIHSAKGLEFPVVFLPGMEEGLFPGQQSALSPSELEEERRLAYVAITRARDRLYILNAKERLMYGRTQYNMPSRFIAEIPEKDKDEEKPAPKIRFRTEFGEKTRRITISNQLTKPSSVSSGVGKTHSGDVFAAGDRVRHLSFGTGTVLSVREMGADLLYEIAFDTVGTKKLMATYAKLKKE
ncbi:MAG: UvrD-helicase domain-containing protein [Eubacteriales bacterium]|nr:UvrD-helicase domain-containing protein [Eubacteriales bacterium]